MRPDDGPPRAEARKDRRQKKDPARQNNRLALKTFASLFMASLATSRDRLKGCRALAELR